MTELSWQWVGDGGSGVPEMDRNVVLVETISAILDTISEPKMRVSILDAVRAHIIVGHWHDKTDEVCRQSDENTRGWIEVLQS